MWIVPPLDYICCLKCVETKFSVSTETLSSGAPALGKSIPWQKAVKPYQYSDIRRSCWQMLNSIAPFFVLWYLAYRSLEISYLLTLFFAFLAALFGMRCFIIFHDCGHGSFFKNQRWNDIVGIFTGIITFTPYYAWRHSHAVHHASSGDLDRRGVGDVWTLTYDEYQKLPLIGRLGYRLYRNPFVIFFIGPPIDFVVLQRLPSVNASAKPREKHSVMWTNLILLGIFLGMGFTIGFKEYILVQLPIIWIASIIGVYLFYVQHQYENVYWERHEQWILPQPLYMAVPTSRCPKSSSGSRATLASTTFTISARASPITTWKNATTTMRFSRKSSR
jgi:acyl-lipid omega-6 desaturase (Delta-12 desaturase)